MSRTAYYWDAISLEHDTGRHVEQIARAERLRPEAMRAQVPELDARAVVDHDAPRWIVRVHESAYHDWVAEACRRGKSLLDGGDTVVSERSYEAALGSVNAALTAADAVMTGQADNAFCAMRPPGHHALPHAAMGFCLFGNVAIVARYLQEHHKIGRIAIVDFDVHHGNGTQDIFYRDGDVLFVSLHQHPLWPGSGMADEIGEGPGKGMTLNIPIAPFTSESEYLATFEARVLPAVLSFKPEFLLVSAGFDAHRDDPLANLQLTETGFGQLTRWLKQLAGDRCQGHIISCLEGGYNLDALQRSVAAHVLALME
ncbi:MAG TPA: histone deacetylase [Phycisphaerae bacterium]|nr:histone deacetylase [Phycisphaerae bacterium]